MANLLLKRRPLHRETATRLENRPATQPSTGLVVHPNLQPLVPCGSHALKMVGQRVPAGPSPPDFPTVRSAFPRDAPGQRLTASTGTRG
jgi:hypothetical protein